MDNSTSEDTPFQIEDLENEEDLELNMDKGPCHTITKIADLRKLQEG